MTIFATFDSAGRRIASWDTDMMSDTSGIPENAIVISTETLEILVKYPEKYKYVSGSLVEIAQSIASARSEKISAIEDEKARRLAEGVPINGKRISVDNTARTDMVSMAMAASLAQGGSIDWSAGYSNGWICMDNSRFPLPSPADGISLAAFIGDWYSRTVQRARDLKDSALSASSISALNAIDITVGWP